MLINHLSLEVAYTSLQLPNLTLQSRLVPTQSLYCVSIVVHLALQC